MVGGDVITARNVYQLSQNLPRLFLVACHPIRLTQLAEPHRISRLDGNRPLELCQSLRPPAAHEVRPAEGRACAIVRRSKLHGFLGERYGLVVSPGSDSRRHAVQPVSERSELVRAFL